MDFRPRLQSHLFELQHLFPILYRVLCFPTSHYCIIRWSRTEPCHWVICKNLFHWRHLHADLRTGCKLQQLASQIQLRLQLLLHFAESPNSVRPSKIQLQIRWSLPLT